MNAVTSAAQPVTRYELPPGGITLLGYVVRRLHKTDLLNPVQALLDGGRSAEALAQLAHYAASASASFGPAYYQPQFNAVGDTISEPDPSTGTQVTASLVARSPHYRIAVAVELPGGSRLTGIEEITGTTVGVHGLGMPAPAQFDFVSSSGRYMAQLRGVITSELLPGLFSMTRIRAQGSLQLSDSTGSTGTLKLNRQGDVRIVVTPPGGPAVERRERLARPGG